MDKEILSLEEAAEFFGVSIKTFIKLLKEEKVPARKIGREWRFSRKALIDWLSSGDSQSYSSSEGDTKDFFNGVAQEWEEIRKGYYDESIKDIILKMGILKKNMTVMDIGAGDGYISRAVAPLVKKVVAVDISGEMLKQLVSKAKASGIDNIDVLETDGCDMPVDDESMDLIFANMFLHHIEDPEAAIKEINRVLKTGGMVFLADFNRHSNLELKEKMHDLWQGFEHGEIRDWFKANGFRNIKIETLNNTKTGETRNDNGVFIVTATK